MSSKKPTVTINLPGTSSSAATAASGKTAGKKKKSKKKAAGNQSVSLPAAMSVSYRRTDPKISTSGDARIRVTHREYLGELHTTNTYSLKSYELNPGLSATFPWLSSIAKMYESYVFQNLRIEYVPSCGTTTAGSLIMAIDFDAFDYPPKSRAEFMMQHGCVRAPLWDSASYVASPQNLKKFGIQRYTRAGSLADNLDVKTYDVGKLYVDVEGAGAILAGELYISYCIDLFTPQAPYWDYWGGENITVQGADAVTTFPLGGGGTVVSGDLGVQVLDTDRIKFNKTGSYLLTNVIQGVPAPGLYPDLNLQVLSGDLTNTILQNPALDTAFNIATAQRRLNISSPGTILKANWLNVPNVITGILRIAPYTSSIL